MTARDFSSDGCAYRSRWNLPDRVFAEHGFFTGANSPAPGLFNGEAPGFVADNAWLQAKRPYSVDASHATPTTSHAIIITVSDAAGQVILDHFSASTAQYDLQTNNCANVAADALVAGGILSASEANEATGYLTQPYAVYNAVVDAHPLADKAKGNIDLTATGVDLKDSRTGTTLLTTDPAPVSPAPAP